MSINDVLGLILGGGQGKRLYPLTKERAKPAVPLAGKYRLIDIPMSNCFHADIEKIAILTQYNSASLHRHIWNTYNRDVFTKGWVQILAAEQTPYSRDWYQGTADAVRKQIVEIRTAETKYILILAGDHLYRMDFRKFVDFHIANDAEVSIAVQPVPYEDVAGLGILKLDEDNRITNFVEKPKSDEALAGFESGDNEEKPYMASMGIYVFNADFLYELLDEEGDDFGHDLIPSAIRNNNRVFGYVFEGYWEDIGTIRRFYRVNLDMAAHDAPFDFYDAESPIYTHARFLPGSEVFNARLHNVLLADGCRIESASINDAVVGLRSIIGEEAKIKETVMMGADFLETDDQKLLNAKNGLPNIGIGAHSVISGAIIDKNARIGNDVTIRYKPDREDTDQGNWVSVDGIIVIPKNAIIPDGTVI
ncbi:MAG: glucose-1-phosphate adenylyltransferase [Candidatus Promineifilaceae bacterium]|jgi:glucose-1-phosphate adenylyltransferase